MSQVQAQFESTDKRGYISITNNERIFVRHESIRVLPESSGD